MAVKIRLKRMGKIRQPYYRVVVVDSRKKRDGKVIEEIGKYHPKEEPSFIEITGERVQYWLGVGAQPSEAVEALLKITGDWQTFKGLPGAEGTLKVAEPKRAKIDLFNEALKDAANEPKREAVTRKKAEKKAPAEAPAAEAVAAETPVVDEAPAVAEAPAVEETPVVESAETPTAEETPVVEPAETPAADAPAAEAPADETTEA